MAEMIASCAPPKRPKKSGVVEQLEKNHRSAIDMIQREVGGKIASWCKEDDCPGAIPVIETLGRAPSNSVSLTDIDGKMLYEIGKP